MIEEILTKIEMKMVKEKISIEMVKEAIEEILTKIEIIMAKEETSTKMGRIKTFLQEIIETLVEEIINIKTMKMK